MDNIQMVFKMYDFFGKGDMESIKREIFHPDISWTMPGHHPLSARMEGADAVIAFFGALFQAGIVVDNVHFGTLDDGTVVEKHMGHGRIGGEVFDFPTCTTYGFKDGKAQWDAASRTMMGNGLGRHFEDMTNPKEFKMWGEYSVDKGKTWMKAYEASCKR